MSYQVKAQNHAEASENKIHDNRVAARYGFIGALVPGVAVYGYLTYPVVQQLGESWLGRSTSEVRFHKPAYQDDLLTVTATEQAAGLQVECVNQEGKLLATLTTNLEHPSARSSAFNQPPFQSTDRAELTWDTLEIAQPFEPFQWQLSARDNQTYVDQVNDSLEIYTQGFLHPHLILSQANTVLTRKFVMPAWIHIGSIIQVHQALHDTDLVVVTARPRTKWQKKGHDFVLLDIAYSVNGTVAVEIEHTAIFKIAEVS